MRKKNLWMAASFSLLLVFLLTPRFWEPGTETWKAWAEANILRQTGGFPFYAHGPLYVLYLNLFAAFSFPTSVFIEYVITHVFCYTALFLLLRKSWKSVWSWALLVAWIPQMSVLEPSAALAGMGFLAIYLKNSDGRQPAPEVLPIPLLAAALCHSMCIPFLFGHMVGAIYQNRSTHGSFLPRFRLASPQNLGKAAFLALIFLTVFHPSPRWDHNHMMMHPRYSPIPLADPLTIGFFQIGDFYYAARNFPPDALYQQDWYFTHAAAFDGAQTIPQAIVRRPDTVVKNLGENFGGLLRSPLLFVTGSFKRKLVVDFFLALFSYGLIGLGLVTFFHRCRAQRSIALATSLTFGLLAALMAFLLTSFSPRYVLTALPAGLLLVQHGLNGLMNLPRVTCPEVKADFAEETLRQRRFLTGTGLVVILTAAALCAIPPAFNALSQIGRTLSPSEKAVVWAVILGLVIIVIGFGRSFWALIKREELWTVERRSNLILARGSLLAVCLLVLSAAPNPHGWTVQLKAVLTGKPLLVGDGSGNLPMATVYPKLKSTLDEQTRVLALEDIWIKAHTKVNVENVFNVFFLPPFQDPGDEVKNWLSGLDAIWVSRDLSTERTSVSTQEFLRYERNIRPFLEKALAARTWAVEPVEGYGEVWRKAGI